MRHGTPLDAIIYQIKYSIKDLPEKPFVKFDRRDSVPPEVLARPKFATRGEGSWAMPAIGRSQTCT